MEENNIYDITLHSQHSGAQIKNSLSYLTSSLDRLKSDLDSYLCTKEKLYYETLQYPLRQKSYLLGKRCAKSALFHIYPEIQANSIEITHGVFGFPYVMTPDSVKCNISTSHSNDTGIAIVFQPSEIMGVDVEEISAARIETIRSELTANECRLVDSLKIDSAVANIMAWTIKEALSKVLRTGMLIDFKLLEIADIKATENYYVASFVNFTIFKAIAFKIDNNGCALVFPQPRTITIDPSLQSRFK
jgi:phosphopantetheinyl transferase